MIFITQSLKIAERAIANSKGVANQIFEFLDWIKMAIYASSVDNDQISVMELRKKFCGQLCQNLKKNSWKSKKSPTEFQELKRFFNLIRTGRMKPPSQHHLRMLSNWHTDIEKHLNGKF